MACRSGPGADSFVWRPGGPMSNTYGSRWKMTVSGPANTFPSRILYSMARSHTAAAYKLPHLWHHRKGVGRGKHLRGFAVRCPNANQARARLRRGCDGDCGGELPSRRVHHDVGHGKARGPGASILLSLSLAVTAAHHCRSLA